MIIDFLSHTDIFFLKHYIQIWANYEGFAETPAIDELKQLAAGIKTKKDIRVWFIKALDEGIDPL